MIKFMALYMSVPEDRGRQWLSDKLMAANPRLKAEHLAHLSEEELFQWAAHYCLHHNP